MDKNTLIAGMEFCRNRTLGTLAAIEKSGKNVAEVLAWRPGPGRANIAWQAMHLAATHDKYLRVIIQGGQPADPALVQAYGGGSTPSDTVPALEQIRAAMAKPFQAFIDYYKNLPDADLERVVGPPERRFSLAQAAQMMAWHEAHHQGQMHLTWNMLQAKNQQ